MLIIQKIKRMILFQIVFLCYRLQSRAYLIKYSLIIISNQMSATITADNINQNSTDQTVMQFLKFSPIGQFSILQPSQINILTSALVSFDQNQPGQPQQGRTRQQAQIHLKNRTIVITNCKELNLQEYKSNLDSIKARTDWKYIIIIFIIVAIGAMTELSLQKFNESKKNNENYTLQWTDFIKEIIYTIILIICFLWAYIDVQCSSCKIQGFIVKQIGLLKVRQKEIEQIYGLIDQ